MEFNLTHTPKNAERIMSGDDLLGVEFYKNVADGLDHVRMFIPADKLYQPDFIATPEYQQRFHRQWEAYQSQSDQFEGQTRLEEVAWLDDAMRNELRGKNIFTIEQLASVQDTHLEQIGHGARTLRDRAKAVVEASEKAAAFDGQAAEMAALKERIAQLEGAKGATLSRAK